MGYEAEPYPLVGSVSVASGVGLMETKFHPTPDMQAEFDLVRSRSNKPIGLHLLIAILQARADREKEILD